MGRGLAFQFYSKQDCRYASLIIQQCDRKMEKKIGGKMEKFHTTSYTTK